MQSRESLLTGMRTFWAMALSTLNKNVGYEFLETPQQAISFKPFNQRAFVKHVNTVLPSAELDPRGICFAYHIVSFAYAHLGLEQEFHKAIQGIAEAKEFNERQTAFIQLIKECQARSRDEEVGVQVGEHVVIISRANKFQKKEIHEDSQLESDLKSLIQEVLEMAIDNAGSKIGLAIIGEEIAHLVGLSAKKENDKLIVQYDDPESYVQVKFDSAESAQGSIMKLLYFRYQQNFSSFWNKKIPAAIHLAPFSVFSGPELDQRELEWVRANKSNFFTSKKAAPESAPVAGPFFNAGDEAKPALIKALA